MASKTRLGCKAGFDRSLLGRGPVESREPSCPQPPLFTRSCAGPCFGSVPTKHPAGPRREDRGRCQCTWRTETMLWFKVEQDIPRLRVSACDAGGRLYDNRCCFSGEKLLNPDPVSNPNMRKCYICSYFAHYCYDYYYLIPAFWIEWSAALFGFSFGWNG